MNSQVCSNAIVIDTGSHSTKIGFSGDNEPQCIIRTATGILDNAADKNKNNNKKFDKYLIDTSLNACDENTMKQIEIDLPYTAGFVHNMESLASIWMNAMKQKLKLSESEIASIPILLSEPSHWSNSSIYCNLFIKYRENYCKTIFEDFHGSAMYLCCDSVLSSFSHGKKSSIVLDFGGGSTRCTPIYDGYVINNGCKFSKCGGDYFDKILSEKINIKQGVNDKLQSYNHKPSYMEFSKHSLITDIKEHILRVKSAKFDVINVKNKTFDVGDLTFPYKESDSYELSPDNKKEKENEINETKECIYVLPDGESLEYGDLQYSITELLFMDYNKDFENDLENIWIDKMSKLAANNNNNNANACYQLQNTQEIWKDVNYKRYKFKGIASMVNESLNGCDIDIRSLCVENIIICGGHSRYKGIIERIGKELSINLPYSYKYKLYFNDTPRERLFATWLGGSILSTTAHFQNMWITKEDYNEYGPTIVHRKCY